MNTTNTTTNNNNNNDNNNNNNTNDPKYSAISFKINKQEGTDNKIILAPRTRPKNETIETKPSEPSAIETKPSEPSAIETIPSEPSAIETKPSEPSAIETEPSGPLPQIRDRRNKVLENWDKLLKTSEDRKQTLLDTKRYYLLMKELKEFIDWINEKQADLTEHFDFITPDLSFSLFPSSSSLTSNKKPISLVLPQTQIQEKNMQFKAFRAAILDRTGEVGALLSNGKEILDQDVNLKDEFVTSLLEKLEELENIWDILNTSLEERFLKFEEFQKDYLEFKNFEKKFKQVCAWLESVGDQISTVGEGQDVRGTEELLKQHDETKRLIDAHNDDVTGLLEKGEQLIQSGHYASQCIDNDIAVIKTHKDTLTNLWEFKFTELDECLKARLLETELRDAYRRIDGKIQILMGVQGNLGDNMDSIELLVRNHATLVSTCLPLQSELPSLQARVEEFINSPHIFYLQSELKNADEYLGLLNSNLDSRTDQLNESLAYQTFSQQVSEFLDWMQGMLLIVNDDNYSDMSNIQNKMNRFESVITEIQNNRKLFEDLKMIHNTFIEENHFAVDKIKYLYNSFSAKFEELQINAKVKQDKFEQALLEVKFLRSVEELQNWISVTSSLLSDFSTDKELNTILQLLRRQESVEENFILQKTRLDSLISHGKELSSGILSETNQTHFHFLEITEKCENLSASMNELNSQLTDTRLYLTQCRQLQEYLREFNTVHNYLEEIISTINSCTDLNALHKISTRFENRKSLLDNLLVWVDKIDSIEDHKIAAEKYETVIIFWDETYKKLKENVKFFEEKKISNEFTSNCTSARTWLEDKRIFINSCNPTRDMSQVSQLVRTVGNCRTSLLHFQNETISKLTHRLDQLNTEQNRNAGELAVELDALNRLYTSIYEECINRDAYLTNHTYIMQLIDRVNSTIHSYSSLITGMQSIYGTALNSVYEIQQQQHTLRLLDHKSVTLQSSTEQLMLQSAEYTAMTSPQLAGLIRTLVAAGNRLQSVSEQYTQLTQKTSARLSSRLIVSEHIETIQETIGWIEDKQVALLNREVSTDTLSSVENEYRELVSNQHVVLAISRRVEELTKTGGELERDKQTFSLEMKKYKDKLLNLWAEFKKNSDSRLLFLRHTVEFLTITGEISELSTWLQGTSNKLQEELPILDKITVEAALITHQDIVNEIKTKTDTFQNILKQSDALINAQHPSRDIISSQTLALKQEIINTEVTTKERYEHLSRLQSFLELEDDYAMIMGHLGEYSIPIDGWEIINNLDNSMEYQNELIAVMNLYEERVKSFTANCDKLLEDEI